MLETPSACFSLAPRHPLYSSGISSSVTSSSSSTAGLATAEDTSWVTLGSGVSLGYPCGQVRVWGALTGAADRNSAQEGQRNQQAEPHGTGTLGTPLAPLGDPRAPSPSVTLGTPPQAVCHPQHHPVLPTFPQKPLHIPTISMPPPSPVPSAIPTDASPPVPTMCPVPHFQPLGHSLPWASCAILSPTMPPPPLAPKSPPVPDSGTSNPGS